MARAIGTGAVVAAVCAVPATVAGLSGGAGAAPVAVATPLDDPDEVGRQLDLIDGLLARELPATFAGTWLSPKAGVTVVAATEPVPDRLRQAIRTLLPAGTRTDFAVAAVPARRLTDLAGRIDADRAWFAQHDIGLTGRRLHVAENVVRVWLTPGTPRTVVSRVLARYGTAGLDVVVEDDLQF